MLASIRVSEYVNPERGTRPWNAVEKAIKIKPEVRLIGVFNDEKYYRVQSAGRDAHCCVLSVDTQGEQVIRCDCEAAYLMQLAQPCIHHASVLIQEAEDARPKPGKCAATTTKKRGAKQKQRHSNRNLQP